MKEKLTCVKVMLYLLQGDTLPRRDLN